MTFSLRWLLALFTCYALMASLWAAGPSWQLGVVEILLMVLLPALSAAQIPVRSGLAKVFWVGMLASASFATFAICIPTYSGFFLFGDRTLQFALEAVSKNIRPTILLWAITPIIAAACVLSVSRHANMPLTGKADEEG